MAAGEEEGAVRRSIACELPERGWWFAPTIFTEVAPAHRIAVEEIFGPVVSVLTFRTQAEAIEKANNSTYGLAAGIWTDKGAKAFEVASALQAGVVWQNTYNHFDPTAAFGGYKESGFGREGGPAGLRPYLQVVMSRLAVPKTYKLYIGGAFVRSESGRYDRHDDRNVPRGSRKDVRDAVKAARSRRRSVGGAHRLQPRPDPLPRGRGAGVARRPTSRVERRRGRGRRSTCSSTTPAGPTSSQPVLGGVNPVAAPFLSFSLPEPTGVVGVVAPDEPELLGLVAELAPALAAGNTVVAVLSEAAPLGGLDLGEVLGVSDVPGGVVNLLSGRRDELASALAAHRGLNAIVDASGDPVADRGDRPAGGGERDARAPRRARPVLRAGDRRRARRLEAVTELKTAWHPVGA